MFRACPRRRRGRKEWWVGGGGREDRLPERLIQVKVRSEADDNGTITRSVDKETITPTTAPTICVERKTEKQVNDSSQEEEKGREDTQKKVET